MGRQKKKTRARLWVQTQTCGTGPDGEAGFGVFLRVSEGVFVEKGPVLWDWPRSTP